MSTKGGRRIPPTTKAVGSLRRLIVDGVMDRFRSMLDVRFEIRAREASLEGIQRQEIWEYPLEALREALVNALCHRDYIMSADIQIRVYDDQLRMWSPGVLPQTLTPEQLYEPQHQSVLRNPLIAQVFYYAGFIERWGSGTTRILSLCAAHGLPQPRFEEYSGGVTVTFYQDPFSAARLQKMGIGERQLRLVDVMRERGSVQMADLVPIFPELSDKTLQRDLRELIERGVVRALGERKGRKYELAR